ncbi:MAG TPA: hypothetical protein VGJ87_15270 [Roseiflexaceae bacterium]
MPTLVALAGRLLVALWSGATIGCLGHWLRAEGTPRRPHPSISDRLTTCPSARRSFAALLSAQPQ